MKSSRDCAASPLPLLLLLGLTLGFSPRFAAAMPQQTEASRPEVVELLSKVSATLRMRDYDGTFVYHRPRMLKTMRIVHKNMDGKEYRRLITMDGEHSEVIHDPAGVRCIFPKQKTILAGQGRDRLFSAFSQSLPDLDAMRLSMSEYAFWLLAEDRVVDREAWVVNIVPRDQYRYGYRLWIDKREYFPLRIELRSRQGKVLENIVFVHLDMPEQLPEELLYPDFPTQNFTWKLESDARDLPSGDSVADWRIDRLPKGFRLKSQNIYTGDGSQGSRGQLMQMAYSDGLATFSVFVREAAQGKHLSSNRMMLDGGVHVYTRIIDDWEVTVIGEVPRDAVIYVGESLRRRR